MADKESIHESPSNEGTANKQRIVKVKKHFKKHKGAYLSGGVCFLIGAAGAIVLGARTEVGGEVVAKINQIGVVNKAIILVALGDPGDVVRIIKSTPEMEKLGIKAGMYFQSRGALARAIDTTITKVSGHLNGDYADVKGLVAEVVGKAGQPVPV